MIDRSWNFVPEAMYLSRIAIELDELDRPFGDCVESVSIGLLDGHSNQKILSMREPRGWLSVVPRSLGPVA